MNIRSHSVWGIPALSLLLSACAGTAPAPVVDLNKTPVAAPRTPAASAAPAGSGSVDAVVVSPLPEPAAAGGMQGRESADPDPVPGAPPAAVAGDVNPAVASLLNRANLATRNGDHGRAASSIERALKIQPDNAWLWHRLAQARLLQGRPGQAAALAARSNSLVAAGSGSRGRNLKASNWLLIARVHRQRGEAVAARAATDRARRIRSGAG